MTTAQEAGRALAAQRRRVTIKCERCGKEVSGLKTRRYCSDACRVAAARERSSESADCPTPDDVVQTGGRITDELIAQMNAFRARIALRQPRGYCEESSVDSINAARDKRVDEL